MGRKRLPSNLHRLSVREVQTAGEGDHSDGGGLLLRVRGDSANWVLRYTAPCGKRREMGLGPVERGNPAVSGRSLTGAREQAYAARSLLQQGVDPIDEREARKRAQREADAARRLDARRDALTLARVAREYHERVIEPARTRKHAAQWIASLENHMPLEIWHKPIAAIEPPELLDLVAQLQTKIPETASRLRQRLETIFDDAVFRKLCAGNPAAAIRRKLRETKRGRQRGQFAALSYTKAPAFMRELRGREGIAARALEFGMLTAARTGEIIGAQWGEFGTRAELWTVPAERMKGGEAHTVSLVPRAIDILQAMHELNQPYVFPSPMLDGRPISNMAMLNLLRRMNVDGETTVHGLCRATFSTWAYETAAARPDVIEACLAHRESDRVKAAYNRAQFAAERRALLLAWADYLDCKAPANELIDLPQAKAA